MSVSLKGSFRWISSLTLAFEFNSSSFLALMLLSEKADTLGSPLKGVSTFDGVGSGVRSMGCGFKGSETTSMISGDETGSSNTRP